MRIIVCGDRNWKDKTSIMDMLKRVRPTLVIVGGAKGADTIARQCAAVLKIPSKEYMADWQKYGKAAGPIRNKQMLDEGKPNRVVAFHDSITQSKGTLNMIKLATKYRIPVDLYGECGFVQYNVVIG